MNSINSAAGGEEPIVAIRRVADSQWHAIENERVVGSADVSDRPDGRSFVSIDSWHGSVFDQLAAAMVEDLAQPLYTVVDETDEQIRSGWERVGFATRRREWEYLVPTDPAVTGLGSTLPDDVAILAAGTVQEGPLRALDRAIRDEVEASVGWQQMPAEVIPRRDGDTLVDPSKYAVATQAGEYVGLIRVVQVTRLPRIGLLAVRSDRHRQGIARALLAHSLGVLHERGIRTASTEINESNAAALALFDGIGARRMSSNLELVLR